MLLGNKWPWSKGLNKGVGDDTGDISYFSGGMSMQYCWQLWKGCDADKNYRQHQISIFMSVFMIRCIALWNPNPDLK